MATEPFKIEMGVTVRDRVTGFEGIVIGRTQWLYGCHQYAVKTKQLKDHVPIPASFFDEASLEVVAPMPAALAAPAGAPRGGPADADSPSESRAR